ncbi:cbb3-type cytochrome c oxidase subunit I [Salinarchaeum laminariae]|uniref:cbb3-type cytochrome c oxidase subunit I n=1 Tax=Salinarchaeum laminariae TaxID=869888 RepID=UPI0020BEFA97|nr:cbb3-type cytochrome c oxidase subunit I [Salinarchaeum laminariae]
MTEAAHGGDHDDGGHLPPKDSIKRWFVTTNHKDIGILYLITSLFFLVAGGILALLIRVQLWSSGGTILSAIDYNQAVTLHGLLMVFWFLSPIGFGFANYFVPLQIGAKDLAFPRLNALSYWLYLASGLVVFASFFQGGAFTGGWTMYAPLNMPINTPTIGGTATILGLTLFIISTTVSTINFLTSIHRMRAEGMGLWNLPMFTWSILLTVWMMLFAFAALLAALLLLAYDRVVAYGLGGADAIHYFGPEASGSLLWAHLFWFFGHPEVYIVFFPALGVMFEIFQTFTGRRIVGRKWVILAMVLVAVQSFLVWMHHMFLSAINLEIKTLIMATTIGISLPFDLMVFSMIYTTVKGKVRFATPFLFVLGALLLFILGGITGVFLGAVVLDYEFRGTYWVVAHFHYVMLSGVTALVGGMYYWWPKMTGKMYSEYLGKIHFATYFIGFNLVYLPMFFAWETPRRVFNYGGSHTIWHQMATVGAFVFAFSFVIMFYTLAKSYLHGADAPDNPWEYSQTAEWAISSPPSLENWDGRVSYASGSLEFVSTGPASTQGSTAAADGGTAATDGGAMVASQSEAIEPVDDHEEAHPDHASIWPAAIGGSLFVFFLGLSGLTTGGPMYTAITGVGLLLFLGACLGFGLEQFDAPEPAVAERWPFEGVGKNKLGMWFFLASDVIVFGAVIGAYIFSRIAYGWSEWHHGEVVPPFLWPGMVNTFVLLTSSFTVVLAMVYAERGSKKGLVASLGTTIMLGFLFLGIKAWEWSYEFSHGIYPWTDIWYTSYFVTTGLHGLHVILGMAVAIFMFWRATNGAYLEDDEPVELFGLYWHFVDIVWVFLFPMFYLM